MPQADLPSRFENDFLMSADALIQDVDSAMALAQTSIIEGFSADEGGWRQFLGERGRPTTVGTACAVLSLINTELSPYTIEMRAAAEFLAASARDDGGWSKPALQSTVSITLHSALAVLALSELRAAPDHPSVAAGLNWFRQAQNTDGGWGQLPSDQASDVVATAYVLRALHEYREQVDLGDVPSSGCDWLASRCQDGLWQASGRQVITVSWTAHAVEALSLFGRRADYDRATTMLSTTAQAEMMPETERHGVPSRYLPEGSPDTLRLSWTHLPSERCLSGLMALGYDPLDRTVVTLANRVLARQQDDGSWAVQGMPNLSPTWAALEATRSLRRFRTQLKQVGAYNAAAAQMAQAQRLLTEVRDEIDRVDTRVGAFESRLTDLENSDHRRPLNKLKRGISIVSRSLAKWRIPAVLVSWMVLTVAYLATDPISSGNGVRLVGTVTIAGTALGAIGVILAKSRTPAGPR